MAGRLEPFEIVHFFLEMNSWYCDNDPMRGFHEPINPSATLMTMTLIFHC